MNQKEILKRSKKAYVTGFLNQALALNTKEDVAVKQATKAASFREQLVTPEVNSRLEKRANLLRETILEANKS